MAACNAPEKKEDRYSHIEDTNAKSIIKRAIDHAGGLDQWESIKQLKYTKDFSLLFEDGTVEKAFKQVHNYQYSPLSIQIESEENGELIRTIQQDGGFTRTVNGSELETSQEALAKAVNTSTYVVSMPFKLLDPGAQLSYEGVQTLEGGAEVDVIKVAYNADKHANHSTSDVWKYYFSKEDGRILANWVDAGDHFALIENLSFVREGGILFNKERKSYRVDSLGNKLYLRAEYLYDNYAVDF